MTRWCLPETGPSPVLARDFGEVLLRVELEEMEPASEEDEDSAPEG